MRVRTLGIRELDFESNGEKIQGTQIFYSHPYDGVIGEITGKAFVRPGVPLPPELAPGKILDIFYDDKKHIEVVQIAPSSNK